MERDFIWILAGLMFIRLLNVVSGIWRGSEYGFREFGRRGRAIIGLSLAILSLQIQFAYADVSFVDVTEEAGLDALGRWEGATFGDYDRDGDLDLYIARYNGGDVFYENTGGGRFQDKTADVGIKNFGVGVTTVSGDYDNDGDLDIYVAVQGSNQLYVNDGKGIFQESAVQAGVRHLSEGQGAAFVDYDNDGDLDIFTLNSAGASALYQNKGDGTFADVARDAGVRIFSAEAGMAWFDFDDDGDQDVYIARGAWRGSLVLDRFYRNDGDGSFTEISKAIGMDALRASSGPTVGDYDNDGDLDLYIACYSGRNLLYRNEGDGTFVEVSGQAGVDDNKVGISSSFGDYDNDGYLDLYVTNFGRNLLYHNNGDGTFTDVSEELGVDDNRRGWSVVFVDYNTDGALDLLVTNGGWFGANQSCVLYENTGSVNNWLHIRLVGTTSNRSGIGAWVLVNAGSLNMMREISGGSGWGHQDTLFAEFGLGDQVQADSVEVHWPSGDVQRFTNVPANQGITVTEGSGITEGLAVVQPQSRQLSTWGRVKRSRLLQNYPNPFNPETWIPFRLKDADSVSIKLYDTTGGLVRTLDLGHKDAGVYVSRWAAAYWDGKNEAGEQVSSGIYFYTIQAGEFTDTKKMVVAR